VPISDDDFGEQIGRDRRARDRRRRPPSYFERSRPPAFRWFSDEAVDVAVVEVGLSAAGTRQRRRRAGRGHHEHRDGPQRVRRPDEGAHRREKAGIVKPHSAVVVGETDPDLVEIFASAGGASVLVRGEQFDVVENQLALGGPTSTCARRRRSTRTSTSRSTGATRPTTPSSR
jgi:dihydrofolate synthase/folylpolyglutamate synthase